MSIHGASKEYHMGKWNREKLKIWLEAGLALLLVLTLGLAGARGVFADKTDTASAKTAVQTDAKASDENGKAGEEAKSASGKASDDSQQKSAGKKAEAEETIADGQYPIMGESAVTVEEMVAYFESSGKAYPAEELSKGGADSIETFCQMYYDEATAEGVRPEVAFAQTMKETGFLQYGGDAQIEQFNFAGIGTTGGGVPGNSYPDVRTGIRAQIQHLKAYATADALAQECVDDRYEYVKKGAAPYVEWLGQQENPEGLGWATGENYGYDIVDMIENMKTIG